MPMFTVMRSVDAYVHYTAEIEADDAKQAAQKAKNNEEQYVWIHDSTSEYDARFFETLDDEGVPIEDSAVGDL
jgi:hypothetical protein